MESEHAEHLIFNYQQNIDLIISPFSLNVHRSFYKSSEIRFEKMRKICYNKNIEYLIRK